MKAFQFRLEKILQLRSFYEEKAKIELGRCVSESEKIKNILKHIAFEKTSTRKSMSFSNFDMHSFLAAENYLKSLDAKKELMLEELAVAEIKVAKARKVFSEATRQRKVLSKLKERQEAQWKKEILQEEAAILDDIVNSKVGRAKISESKF